MKMAICKRCLVGDYIPDMKIKDGICDLCRLHDKLNEQNPIGDGRLHDLVIKIKKAGKGKRYDCIVGISGGCDSSYLLYLAVKAFGLRVLAVHLDNHWNTSQAENNMKNIVNALNVDLLRIQINKKTYTKLNTAFLEASVQDADAPQDMAIMATWKDTARRYKIKYILAGHSFRTEGSVPLGWSYLDAKYVESVYYWYWKERLSNFPLARFSDHLKTAFLGIKEIRPLNYIQYRKSEAKKLLAEKFDWQDYGGLRLENDYCTFVTSYLLPKKFNVDKRIIELSTHVRQSWMTKSEAMEELEKKPYMPKGLLQRIKKDYPKLETYMNDKTRRTHKDFETYHRMFRRYRWLIWLLAEFNLVPKTFYSKYARGL